MALRAHGTRVDDPVDAALRAPHPAVLVSWALAFVAVLALLAAVERGRSQPAPGAAIAVTVLLALAVAGAAAVLLSSPRARTRAAAIAGLALMDVVPPLLQMSAQSPTDARALVSLLILPTMIAASSLAGTVFYTQLAIASGMAVAMLLLAPGDRGLWNHIIEVGVAVGVLVTGSVMVRRISATTARHIADLRRLALTDKLTEVLNRRGLADGFAGMCAHARSDGTIGVLSLDIDHFKWFNDTYGHPAGDDVLRLVCAVLRQTAGPGSLVARTGGEELVALVHGPAEPVGEAFRAALAETKEPRVTVSIGIIDAPMDACVGPDALWQILDAAVRYDLLPFNPVKGRVEKLKETAPKRTRLTGSQVQALPDELRYAFAGTTTALQASPCRTYPRSHFQLSPDCVRNPLTGTAIAEHAVVLAA